MGKHIYEKEFNRLLAYGRSLGCKITVKHITGREPRFGGEYDEETSTIEFLCLPRYSLLDRIIYIGHELGHHKDFATRGGKWDLKEELSYAEFLEKVGKGPISHEYRDLVVSMENRAGDYMLQIFHTPRSPTSFPDTTDRLVKG